MLALVMILLLASPAQQPPPAVRVAVSPPTPYLERSGGTDYLNCDFVIENTGDEPLRLEFVQVSVFDRKGKLVLRKFLNDNGPSPSIWTIPNREIAPGDVRMVFNPFYALDRRMGLHELRYQFVFRSLKDKDREVRTEVIFAPQPWLQKTNLVPPLKGRFIVWDGHDFYSHHRRWDVTHPVLRKMGMKHNPDRYAYDLSIINQNGDLYRRNGETPEDWFGFGTPVYAPGAGRVVEAVNTAPDTGSKNVDFEAGLKNPKVFCGNYVLLDHRNGEYSLACHMKKGSVQVKPGDGVRQGQQIGEMGFSGDAITVHVHYQLQAGSEYDVEGLPSYFSNFRRVLGSRTVQVDRGVIDSGDIIER